MDEVERAIRQLQSGHLEHADAVSELLTSMTQTLTELVRAVNGLDERLDELEERVATLELPPIPRP